MNKLYDNEDMSWDAGGYDVIIEWIVDAWSPISVASKQESANSAKNPLVDETTVKYAETGSS